MVAGLDAGPNFVLQAEPGAGKTTRIPTVLLDHGVAETGEIVVAQPRRLAARMAAARIAALLDESVGQTCGYQVRFDSKVSKATRIRFVTEGLLVRQLREDPSLGSVSCVVLDEFHERHVETDLALALLRRLQTTQRPELRIGVMSATLDPDPIAAYLGCESLRCAGRAFDVSTGYQVLRGERTVGQQVATAVDNLASDGLDGSVLVFLPGAAEIREANRSCQPLAKRYGLEIVSLHGDLKPSEQDRAVAPGGPPKLILSTNVAETSVTIEGVSAVVDSGLVRRASYDPWSGIPTLTLAKISKASAKQRAGRAGRTQAGRCVRLYSQHDHARRPEFDTPQIARLDLSGVALDLRAAGLSDASELRWFEAPPQTAMDGAHAALRRIGALDEQGRLTPVGRQMLSFPTHPRVARLLVAGRTQGISRTVATAAALITERPIRRFAGRAQQTSDRVGDSDLSADIADLEAFSRGARTEASLGLDASSCRIVLRLRDQLHRHLNRLPDRATDPEEALRLAVLAAFPDRVARMRPKPGSTEVVLAGGGSAVLDPQSVVADAAFVVALRIEARKGTTGPRTIVRSASAIEPEWLLELFPERVNEAVEIRFDSTSQRVEAFEELHYDGFVIDSTPLAELPPEATKVLQEAALELGPEAFLQDPQILRTLELRTRFAASQDPSIPVLGHSQACEALVQMCQGRRSISEVRKGDLLGALLGGLSGTQRGRLETAAPSHVTLPGGRRLLVHYEPDRPPWVQSRLQDFFGEKAGPTLGPHKSPLVLHLLAPNQRAVQVTTDLAGFWERHYPTLRRTLMRRYPKHDWPEDPTTASPPRPRSNRRSRR